MTKPYEIDELERDLRAPAPEPPAELLTALEKEIPQDLAAAARPSRRGWGVRRWQLAAATVVLAVVGLVVGERVRREVPLAAPEPARTVLAPSRPGPEGERDGAVDDLVAAATGGGEGEAMAPGEPGGPSADAERERRHDVRRQLQEEPEQLAEPLAAGEDRGREAAASAGAEADAGKRTERSEQAPTPAAPPPPPEIEAREREQPTARSRPVPVPEPASTGRVLTPPAPPPVAKAGDLRALGSGVEEPPARPKVIVVTSEAPLLDEKKLADAGAAPSTGGTSEPNDQPYGDMFFESAGVNPFIDTEDDRLSTFGLDVDTGSYTVARSYLQRGHLPPAAAVRVEEFVNFFSYGDEAPARGDFALSAEGAPTPFADGPRYQVVRFGVRARDVDRGERRPAVLTFVVDVSGSMAREDRLGLVRRSLRLLLDQLYPEDRVGLVVYGSRGRVLLEPTGDHEAVRREIDRLTPEGSTNAEEGLVLGYELAQRHFRAGASNRVILCSDGVANVGRTGPESILSRIEAAAAKGIELTTVGFGMGNYNDVLMERLADQGDGRYAYVDTLEEARRLFVYELTGTLETIASDARVQVDFDPGAVARYRLLGYENRDIVDERFRDDTVDAGEIGAGHEVSAVYEVKLAPGARARDRLARLSLRYRSVASSEMEEVSLDLRVGDLARSWDRASPGLKLASVVAEFAEILRASYWAREGDLADLRRRARELAAAFADAADVAELVELIAGAERLTVADDPPSD